MKKVLFVAMLFGGSLMAQNQKEYLVKLDTAEVHTIGKSKFIEWKLADTVAVITAIGRTKLMIHNTSQNPITIEVNGTCDDGTFEVIDLTINPGESPRKDCANCAIYLKETPSRFVSRSGLGMSTMGIFR